MPPIRRSTIKSRPPVKRTKTASDTQPIAHTLTRIHTLKFQRDNIRRYGRHVIEERALVDYRDGLKPVHRRIIWGMYEMPNRSTGDFRKCARAVGEVMGKYHPHGDCLGGDTRVALCSGGKPKIKDLVGKGRLWVWAMNEDGFIVPALAHSWRVGQVARKIYTITLTSGESIRCTGNHPFYYLVGGCVEEIRAENIRVGDDLIGGEISESGGYQRLRMNNGFDAQLHHVSGVYSHGERAEDEQYHHVNEDTHDNRPSNIELKTHGDHAKEHGNYLEGLKLGRQAMFGKTNKKLRRAIREKNARLAKEVSKNYGLYKALRGLRLLLEENQDLTVANYKTLRKNRKLYNLTKLETLNAKGISFEDLKEYLHSGVPIDTSDCIGLIQREPKRSRIPKIGHDGRLLYKIAEVFRSIDGNPLEVTDSIYDSVAASIATESIQQNESRTTWYSSAKVKSYYGLDEITEVLPLLRTFNTNQVISVSIETVAPTPMYDFTVDTHANMLVYTSANTKNVILAHNSSLYMALVNMANYRTRLIQGQGNFGVPPDDPPAAMRYTESRLSKFTDQFLLASEYLAVTPMIDNYDGKDREPLYLPSLLPLLLINGSSGIAVGVSAGIPPYTLESVCQVTHAFVSGVPITAEYMADHLEFGWPNGGVCVSDRDTLIQAYTTGKSTLYFAPEYRVDEKAREMVIFGLTPGFKITTSLIEKLERKFEAFAGIDDHCKQINDKLTIDVRIRFKKSLSEDGVSDVAQEVANLLVDNWTLQCNWTIRTEKLDEVGDRITDFHQGNLVEFFTDWIGYRVDLERRCQQRRIEEIERKIAHQNLLIIVATHADWIIKTIRTVDVPEPVIMKKLNLTAEQVQQVMSMTFGQMKRSSVDKSRQEILRLEADRKQAVAWRDAPRNKTGSDFGAVLHQLGVDPLVKARPRPKSIGDARVKLRSGV